MDQYLLPYGGELAYNFSKLSNAPWLARGGWAQLELTEHYLIAIFLFTFAILKKFVSNLLRNIANLLSQLKTPHFMLEVPHFLLEIHVTLHVSLAVSNKLYACFFYSKTLLLHINHSLLVIFRCIV